MRAVLEDMAGLGRRVAEARRGAGLTQAELARAVALDRTAIAKVELADRRLDALELARIAKALRRPMEWFVRRPVTLAQLRRRRQKILGICRRHGATAVRVFGSVARGESSPECDVDLLVRFEPGHSLMDHAAVMVELQDLLECKVDVVPEEGLREHVRERVQREAVPL